MLTIFLKIREKFFENDKSAMNEKRKDGKNCCEMKQKEAHPHLQIEKVMNSRCISMFDILRVIKRRRTVNY